MVHDSSAALAQFLGAIDTEQASDATAGFWTIFDKVNVDDSIVKSYQAQYPNLAAEHSLHEQWVEMTERGEGAMTGFISVADQVRESGWTGVEVARDPTQPIFDITAIPPGGSAEVH